jgi:MFS family permease
MAVARNYLTFLLCRFLLGIFESGIFPGFTYYISLWYARKHQASRVGFLWAFSAIAGASGGLLAYGIDLVQPLHLAGWQLLFIVRVGSERR